MSYNIVLTVFVISGGYVLLRWKQMNAHWRLSPHILGLLLDCLLGVPRSDMLGSADSLVYRIKNLPCWQTAL